MPSRHYGRWRARWTEADGSRRSETFDDKRTARYVERKRKAAVEDVRRGLRSPDPPAKTFDDLCDYWLTERAPQKRSRKDDESIIRRHLRPAFGKLAVRDVGTARTDRYAVEHANLDRKTVHNHLTLLGSMLRVATHLGWLDRMPWIRKPSVRLFDADYCYLRTEEEIRRFLSAARDEGEQVFSLYATAVYTGMREGELAALAWDDVDFATRLIAVQRSFDGPTKAGDVRYVPILDPLLPVLREWRLRHPGRLLFTNRDGGMFGKSGRIFQEVLHRVVRAAAFPTVERRGKRRRYIVFHDLRHTFASHWVMHGGDIFKLQKILGHKSIALTMRYAHLQPTAFADDYARLGGQIPSLAPVIALPRTPLH